MKSRDETGYTPLHFACLNNQMEVARLLLKHDANANARDSKGSHRNTQTPVLACFIHPMFVHHIHRANDIPGATPLHLAAWGGHTAICQVLLTGNTATSRASVNAQTVSGDTALHFAAQDGKAETLALLLKVGLLFFPSSWPSVARPLAARLVPLYVLSGGLPLTLTLCSLSGPVVPGRYVQDE